LCRVRCGRRRGSGKKLIKRPLQTLGDIGKHSDRWIGDAGSEISELRAGYTDFCGELRFLQPAIFELDQQVVGKIVKQSRFTTLLHRNKGLSLMGAKAFSTAPDQLRSV
jgi:hypothetical protein